MAPGFWLCGALAHGGSSLPFLPVSCRKLECYWNQWRGGEREPSQKGARFGARLLPSNLTVEHLLAAPPRLCAAPFNVTWAGGPGTPPMPGELTSLGNGKSRDKMTLVKMSCGQ